MEEGSIKFAIGFVTGRANVCNVINSTYENIINQLKESHKKVELTIFILYDLKYQYTERNQFYNINENVQKKIKIEYISPEDIEEEKENIVKNKKITKEEAELFFGHGHARGRNTLMYYALKENIDYLLFWDDDEYPVACIKEEGNNQIKWKEQDNIAMHLKYIENADVTIGYHCGYISPIPYIELEKIDEVKKENFKNFIEAIGNDIISWESISEKILKNNGITYADENIANGKGAYEIQSDGIGKWVSGSTLCLNLRNIDKIPAFYNPENARGEDTFFSTKLNNSKVIKVPVYHFHDGFLKYVDILEKNYPNELMKIELSEKKVEKRFLQTSRGWIKYKPLFEYITNNEQYENNIKDTYIKLESGVKGLNNIFKNNNYDILIEDLKEYDRNVKKHYEEYIKINEIWNILKNS